MWIIKYILIKILCKLKGGDKEVINDYYRRAGMKIGKGCNICCDIMTAEPFLVEIGENVTISGSVKLLTHDNCISKVIPGTTDMFGPIKIGNNCFLGAGSTILYGVELADNIIVAAGSVVTKSFKEGGAVLAGNPARVITTWDKLAEKSKEYAISVRGLSGKDRENKIKSNLLRK